MNIIKKVFFLLTPSERRQAYLLLLMILIMALLDMIGVASILPFMAVLTNPSLVETNLILNSIYKFSFIFGIENKQQFLFALGILVFVLLVISLTFKAITTYVQVRFIQMREYTIGKRLVEGYLHQPYSWFLNRHSADLGKTILSEVVIVIGETFHISTKRFISILQLVNLINKLMNIKDKNIYHVKERDGKDLKYTLNSNKIRKLYSWSEQTDLISGIFDTIDWVKKNINYFKKATLQYKHKK